MNTQITSEANQPNINNNPAYHADCQRLLGRAFRMYQKLGAILQQIYVLLATAQRKDALAALHTVRNWLLVPFTLWPIDFHGLSSFVCQEITAGRKIDAGMAALLRLVKTTPSETEQAAVGEYEHSVEAGDYDPFVRDNDKYKLAHKQLCESAEFHADLKLIDDIYDLGSRANHKGIIRRTMACERNFRVPAFKFDWSTEDRRFQHVFDAFCWKHELYGLENKSPLLMKVTVNLTAQGMFIYVPKWMSVDLKRDLVISAITKLHKSRGVLRQGPKISESRLERQELARRVYLADEACKEIGIVGEDRRLFIIQQAGLPPATDMRRIRELIKRGEALLATETASHPAGPGQSTTKKTRSETSKNSNARLERARAALALLSPEEKEELIKSFAE